MDMLLRKAAAQKAFSKIGKANGSAPPESTSNTFGAAYELFMAKTLKSAAEARYDEAKKAAAAQGVIDESKVSEGNEVVTYDSDHLSVSLKQSAGSQTLDKTMLSNVLQKVYGFTATQVEALIAESSKPRKGAVNINMSLKG